MEKIESIKEMIDEEIKAAKVTLVYSSEAITAGDLLTMQKSPNRKGIKFITIKDDFHKYRYVLLSVILIDPYH